MENSEKILRKGEIPESPGSARVRHFRIFAEESQLENLKKKLYFTTFPDQVYNENWQYGTELGYNEFSLKFLNFLFVFV